MPKEKLPKLTEAQVRQLADSRSFERGQSYYRGGSISETAREGRQLRALCEGSEDEPYEVSATLDESGVANTDCSCPYDWGGACKHIVALLLTYVHEPQEFHALEPFDQMLAGRSKEELLEIINQMAARAPQTRAVVEAAASLPKKGAKGAVQANKPMNVSAYRSQARRALNSEAPRRIEKELKALRDTAARRAQAGDWLNAGAIYDAALAEAVDGYDDMVQSMDEDGDICIEIDALAKGLGQCLEKSSADAKTRWAWVETLLEAKLADLELGGIDLAPAASEAVLQFANNAEWAQIEERVRTEAAHHRGWAREALIRFLTKGLQQRQRGDEAAQLVRDLGTPEQQAHLLISEKKITEALKLIKQIIPSAPGLVTRFADALLAAKAQQEALALVLEHGGANSWHTKDWLAKYYRKHGTPAEAIAAQQKVFFNSPSVASFKTLHEICRKAGKWDEVRTQVLAELTDQKQTGTLIEIALHEKDVAQALTLLPQLKESGWGWARDYKYEVAQAAEKEQPAAALQLHQELAERAIGGKNRGAYQQAVEHLKRAQKLAERLKAGAEWANYMQELRAKHPTLRALQEELQKARL